MPYRIVRYRMIIGVLSYFHILSADIIVHSGRYLEQCMFQLTEVNLSNFQHLCFIKEQLQAETTDFKVTSMSMSSTLEDVDTCACTTFSPKRYWTMPKPCQIWTNSNNFECQLRKKLGPTDLR